MFVMPNYRDSLVSGLSFDDIVDKAKDAASDSAIGDSAKEAVVDVGGEVLDTQTNITKTIEDAATAAAKAHAETLVEQGGREVDSRWNKAKPWVIGGGITAGVLLAIIAFRKVAR